jgi:type IV pilus assembly protein PilQ
MGFTKTSCVVRCAVAVVTLSSAALISASSAQAESKSQAQPSAAEPVAKDIVTTDRVASTTATSKTATSKTADTVGVSITKPARAQIAAQSVAGTNQIAIPVGAATPKYSVTRLSGPERLVIDLESTQLPESQSIKTKNLAYVSGVRVGAHPNKTRIVVDLKDVQGVTHEARFDNGMLMLTVSAAAGAQKPATTSLGGTQPVVAQTEQSVARVEPSKDEKGAASQNAEVVATQKSLVAHDKTFKQSRLTQSLLVLDEETVVSGSSKTDLAASPATVAKPGAVKQPVVLEKSAREGGAATKVPVDTQASVDRARLSLSALDQQTTAAQMSTPVKPSDVRSLMIASMTATKGHVEAVQTKGSPSLQSSKDVAAKAVEPKKATNSSVEQAQSEKVTVATNDTMLQLAKDMHKQDAAEPVKVQAQAPAMQDANAVRDPESAKVVANSVASQGVNLEVKKDPIKQASEVQQALNGTSSAKPVAVPVTTQIDSSKSVIEAAGVKDVPLDAQVARSPAELARVGAGESAVAASADIGTQNATSTKIASIRIEGQGASSPAVVITLNGSVEHAMTRTAPSEYVVTLREASTETRILQQTLFASPASTGIRSVRAVADGKNTLVRIFTQPSSYLTAKLYGNLLKIEETQDLAQIARDIRAQIVPAVAKEAETGKDATSTRVAKDATTTPKKAVETSDKAVPARIEDSLGELNDGELAAIKGSSLTYTGRLISLDLQDADIDSALRIIAEVSNLNIVAGDGVVGKVTLKLVDVPWDQALEVILKSHGLDKVLEGNVLRVAPVDKLRTERESFKQAKVAEEELEPLSVKYVRVSYAKAAEIKSLVETVLSDRGTVAFDERSNQLVVKDTRKGLQNVAELIKKIDLRTPQILLETQIIEANRNLSRQLGAELGFQYIQSPATGNGTGLNFPSAIAVGGSADPTNANSITGSAFPVASTAALGSAVTMLFDSADGTKSLALRLSQLEQEGQVRIISKPAVATTNNKAAEIKSVEKYRVKLPNGGLSIASGSGATSSGSGDVATQTIEAGIILNVTPQASPDYYILLDIRAKSSSFGAKSVDGIPNEIERSASSSVLVSSGQTFALGGIYKITEQDRVSGVPFFKDIPVLGTFFRNTTTEQADEELLFFITPRIVEGSFEDATVKVIS